MAKCICGREMLTAKGCGIYTVYCNGKRYKRIKVGEDHNSSLRDDERCGDCGALKGRYHHWKCDLERCPACGQQLLSCDCSNVHVRR